MRGEEHITDLKYNPQVNQTNIKDKKENKNKEKKYIVHSPPPFNLQVKTNIGIFCLNLIKKHFRRPSELSNIFSSNTVEVSRAKL